MQFKTRAEQIVHGLIQSYIGPDHKVIDMRTFFTLVAALRTADNEGTHEFLGIPVVGLWAIWLSHLLGITVPGIRAGLTRIQWAGA